MEQTIITVKAVHHGYAEVIDDTGREWHVSICCLDMPDDVWWEGRWIDRQTHPDGAKALVAWLAHQEAEREEGRWREKER